MGAAAGIGAGLGAIGSIFGGIQAQKAGNEEAAEAMRAAETQSRQKRREIDQFKGRQTSQFLSSGVLLEGSPLLVLQDTESQGQQELTDIRESGFRQANRARRAGRNAFIGGMLSGAGQGMQAAGSFQQGSTGPRAGTATGQ